MSLLREIQEAAIDESTPLSVVLRKCLVLGARLGHAPFKQWVEEELNGYPATAALPPYRRHGGLSSIGTFAGGMGRSLQNVPLPLTPLPQEVREQYTTAEFREDIASLEEIAKVKGDGRLIQRWPGDLVAHVGTKFYQGFTLLAAHMEIPQSAVVGVLSAVRNRVLQFALEIEQEEPAAGKVAPGTKPVPDERVTQIFLTYIWAMPTT